MKKLLDAKVKNCFFIFGFFLLIIESIFSKLISFHFIDEIICIFCMLFILYRFITRRMYVNMRVVLFVISIFLGLLSNFVYRVNSLKIDDILLDVFLFLKPYIIVYFVFSYISGMSEYNKAELQYLVNKVSKLFIIILFFGAVISSFSHQLRDGGGYAFFSGYRGDISMITFALISAIYMTEAKSNIIFYILSLVIVISTDSGLGVLGILLFLVINIILKNKKINLLLLGYITLISVIIGHEEIASYLLNINAPRSKMLYTSFLILKKYFPLGSGFGTFGGYIAANNYSELYFEYGISNMYLMGPDSVKGISFLFDFYYPQIIGQLGLFGLLIFIYIAIYYMIKAISNKNNLMFSMIVYVFAMGLGFNICGVSGCVIFAVMGLAYSKSNVTNEILNS